MCGIVGYTGNRSAVPVLLEGLSHLEYRGYDSAGIACLLPGGKLYVVKEEGRLDALRKALGRSFPESKTGIGHTRWATHGEPSRVNAHPHCDQRKTVVLVHNGIIENYAALKAELRKKGVRFQSETDTEVAANLIGFYHRKDKDLARSVRKAVARLKGFFSFVVMDPARPGELVAFRRSNPLCIGAGRNETFVASDVTPLLPYTREVIYLEDEDMALVSPGRIKIISLSSGKETVRKRITVKWNSEEARKGGFEHFMLKEIYEQPRVLGEVVSERIKGGGVWFDTLKARQDGMLRKARRIFMVSCGTAYHAGMAGALMCEQLARLPAQAQVSSEFRYNDPILNASDVVVLITQSGETADTLAAMKEAKRKGAMTLAVVNVVGSTIAREADAVIYTHAGPEIGVASTKAYTAQLMTLALFALYLGKLRGTLKPDRSRRLVGAAGRIPEAVRRILKTAKGIERQARVHYRRKNFLYLGRGYNYPTSLEGALKLKEISYAHAHGYAAGEMKHGPIALIDRHQPVICIAPPSRTFEKMLSNIEEIHAREGIILSVGSARARELKRLSSAVFAVPETEELFSPILAVIPLQLFAYYVAVLNGRDVDKPRNLAKSVTVE